MKKRMIALLLCVVLLLTAFSVVYAEEAAEDLDTTATSEGTDTTDADVEEAAADTDSEDVQVYNFVEQASNKNFSLACDEETTFIKVTDKRTGQEWYSNPPIGLNDDPYVQGIAKTDIRSLLHLYYTNSSSAEKETNSYASSVKKGTYEISKVTDGIRIDYQFKELQVTIPVQFTLTDSGLLAEILFSDIKEEGSNYVNNMDFLAYFGTAGENDEGYMVVPDGSGAIVNFNNGKNVDGMKYSKPIYGKDLATVTTSDVTTSRNETITLPVYGMVKNGYGYLAEVTSGAEMATLKAAVSGNKLVGAYNTIYTNAVYHVYYKLPLMGQVTSTVSDALYNAQDKVSNKTYAVQFHFSDKADVTYTDLAAMYREVLTQRGWLKQDTITDAFYSEFYGGVNKKKSFAGILYDARETLTSFQQANAILQDLEANGVSHVNAMYTDFSDDYFSSNIEIGLSPSGSLGGSSAMSSLLTYAADKGIPMAMAADFVSLPNGGNGFSTFSDVADAVNISPIEVYGVSLNGNVQDTSKKPYYLLDPQKYGKATDTLLSSISKYNYTALYFDADALALYSDLAPEGYQCERTSAAQREQMAKLAESNVQLTFSNPNAYLLEYADYLTDIPVCSSKDIIFDEDVPFVQAVLRGIKNIAGESMNITDVSDQSFLRHLEYGTDMKYALMEADSEVLLTTDHTFLYSAKYENFKEQIAQRYKAFEAFGKAVGESTITAHTRAGNLAVTTYSNGVKVYVNYGSEAAVIDGVSVNAMDYVIQ